MNLRWRRDGRRFLAAALLPVLSLLLVSGCVAPRERVAMEDRECRQVGSFGTRIKESVCKSKEEWARLDAQKAEEAVGVDEFFSRTLEIGSQGQAPSFDSPLGP